MGTIVHFINVGQGNMSLIETSDGKKIIVDCNVTDKNEQNVLNYLKRKISSRKQIDLFICSHRDADHMRGIRKLHAAFPITKVVDNDYPGTTTDSSEYRAYMRLRREVGVGIVKKKTRRDFGRTRLRYLSARDKRLAKNANAQGIVIKVEHLSASGLTVLGSVILTGDSDAETWRYAIQEDYTRQDLACDILIAGHHGSITFFDDPADDKHYYLDHARAMNPAMTIVSVGKNPHGHPDRKALELYKKCSSGSNKGNKLYRTDKEGNMCVHLKDKGGWSINKK